MTRPEPGYVIVGGGFYGCCLALYLRSISDRVTLVEAGETLLDRASRVNQARVHTGFHYPRSALTAVKSMMLHRRFATDFPQAVTNDFQMLYGIARRRSKVSANRFHRMFRDIGAPIGPATAPQLALFDPDRIEAAFACTELAFDHSVLRHLMRDRLAAAGVTLRLGQTVDRVQETGDTALVHLSDGTALPARFVFNVTYAQINALLHASGLPGAALKHELAEVALITPPDQLAGFAITVMDGPFFSTMPYPADRLYSLTHVRYTPHLSWTDDPAHPSAYGVLAGHRPQTQAQHMLHDARLYVPSLSEARHVTSLYEVKTVLAKNEADDGRPILYQRRPQGSRVISILGGKIDNIYDLFDLVRQTEPEFAHAHDGLVTGRAG